VKVYATNGDTKSDATTIDCGVVETSSFEVYGINDPDSTHPSAFAFNAGGDAISYSARSANYSVIDYVIDDVNLTFGIVNAGVGGKGWNAKGNAVQAITTSTYDSLRIAPAPGNYEYYLELATNGLYCLWLDPTNDNWTATDDHFAKLSVTSIQGAKMVCKVSYQKVPGLRWLVK